MSSESTIVNLLTIAWLLPLAGFAVEIFAGYWQKSRQSKAAAWLAVACIAIGFVCSASALWIGTDFSSLMAAAETHEEHGEHAHEGEQDHHGDHHDHSHAGAHADAGHEKPAEEGDAVPAVSLPITGVYYPLARFGNLQINIEYYIDSLTLVMFAMVTLIATCIHLFATGYMSDELTDEYVDHHAHTADGHHVHRPGRFYRFFAYMSLFCFSMLGLVIAGNIFQVFIFWELVGICSYLLIGFYVERKSAGNAANKAFIMNRVGDFGFLIGLMVLWTWCGTFTFGDYEQDGATQPGLFTMFSRVVDEDGHHQIDVDRAKSAVYLHGLDGERLTNADGEPYQLPYMLLVVAGLGVFAGCVGKSAQFPLQTWLPDAMEGPTPVSALVHSATMVAAGVYLAGRFYPVFTSEVLLTIAYVGCITLFVAATIAIVATDIKRVLAYSTISQLGYMMLAIGVGGWGAGLFHLITHAFFKSLMFLASGSVIIGCHHEQEMPRMGGLRRKMPITAYTMLVGVIAIAGLAIPGTSIAFSGYHSKDAIVATALAYSQLNPIHFLLFLIPLVTAGITAFYMFRLWFYTFAGEPRDRELYDHVHESPWVMTGPLLVLSVFAAFVAVGGESGLLYLLLGASEPASVAHTVPPVGPAQVIIPGHHEIHAVHAQAGMYALIAAGAGTLIAFLLYGRPVLNPAEIKRQFSGLHTFLVEKWRFDDLYDVMWVRPIHVVASWATWVDRVVFDGLLHGVTRATVDVSRWDRRFDETVVDGLVNLLANVTFGIGRSFRVVQTGQMRQYIMFIAVGVLTLFFLLFVMFPM